jgi:hypothetical protein
MAGLTPSTADRFQDPLVLSFCDKLRRLALNHRGLGGSAGLAINGRVQPLLFDCPGIDEAIAQTICAPAVFCPVITRTTQLRDASSQLCQPCR